MREDGKSRMVFGVFFIFLYFNLLRCKTNVASVFFNRFVRKETPVT